MKKLFVFDLDDTLTDRYSNRLKPEVAAWLLRNRWRLTHTAIATNQGGVGLRLWMEIGGFGEPSKLPTQTGFIERLFDVLFEMNTVLEHNTLPLFCFAYQSKTTGLWGRYPDNINAELFQEQDRKPNPGMLLKAMKYYRVSPSETVMIGNGEDDRLAAQNAGCDFIFASEFFTKDLP